MYTPEEIMDISIHLGTKKIQKPILAKLILGFIGGAMISLGYLAYIRVSASIPESLASLTSLVGAAVFPIGLLVILLGGGELITGNMMAVAIAFMDKKVTFSQLVKNWTIITLANIVGAIFVAYFFFSSHHSTLNQTLHLIHASCISHVFVYVILSMHV